MTIPKHSDYQRFEKVKKATAPVEGQKMDPTPPDIEGPFYKADAPFRDKLVDDPNLSVEGIVYNTEGKKLHNAVVDYWQADANGSYDLVGFNFRGKVKANKHAHYKFETIIPGDYDISEPTDPEPHDFRCAHIHVKVSAPGHKTLTTQLYFPDDKYNKTDHWFDTRRVINPPTGVFDFVLEKE